MGFSSELQSAPSHNALVGMLHAECQMLESFQVFIDQRTKCEEEFSTSLSLIANNLINSNTYQTQQGMIAKAFVLIAQEVEELSTILKAKTDHLIYKTLEEIKNLLSEKQAIKDLYIQEHNGLFSKLEDYKINVKKHESEYRHLLDAFKLSKSKYEDQYLKGKCNKKLDEARRKYSKTTEKLHSLHNSYVILLKEASLYEARLRESLLPSILDYQQKILEDNVLSWKKILEDYSNHMNIQNETLDGQQLDLAKAIEAINPKEEYKEFLEINKSSPISSIKFEFDKQLLSDYMGTLAYQELAVDNLTFKWLTNELDHCRLALQSTQKNLEVERLQGDVLAESLATGSDIEGFLVKKRAMDICCKQVKMLECDLELLEEKEKMISLALVKVPLDSPPNAIELDSPVSSPVEGSFVSLNKLSAKTLMSRIKQPFATLKKKPSFHLPPSIEHTTEVPVNVTSSSQATNLNRLKSVYDQDFYHGQLDRGEVAALLSQDGDFLLHELAKVDNCLFLSVRWNKEVKPFVISIWEDKYLVEGAEFLSISELISYYKENPISNKSDAILKNPLLRDEWRLPRNQIILSEKIGQGTFGTVFKGLMKPDNHPVAVKTCKISLTDDQRQKFAAARILQQYNHPNLVRYLGICDQNQPFMLVMEFVSGGSLHQYLRSHRTNLNMDQLITISIDVASGMEYLEMQQCLHRDLAARNCLVGDNQIIKISDYGFSKENSKPYSIKWTAPETLNFGQYSSKSDIWSFGIVFWEIFSLGGSPYLGIANDRVKELLKTGYRLPPPDKLPSTLYQIMIQCWQWDPSQRPKFGQIHLMLKNIALPNMQY